MGNKGIIDGLRKGEKECIGPRAGDADLWINIWEELGGTREGTPHEEKKMTNFEMFVTEGNEKAGELAKAGAILDESFMAEARAQTMKQERERRCM